MSTVFGERPLAPYNGSYIVHDAKCPKTDRDCTDSIDIPKTDIDKLMSRVMYFPSYIYKICHAMNEYRRFKAKRHLYKDILLMFN